MTTLTFVLGAILGSYIYKIIRLKRQKKLDELSEMLREKYRKEDRDLFNNIDQVEIYYGDTDGAINVTPSASITVKK